jgi:nucleoside-diphosphate-sugar epimerase
MKILLTGATGFIGSNIIPALMANKFTVGILKRKTSALKSLSVYVNSITIFNYEKYSEIENSVSEFRPDLIIHMATLYINRHQGDDINSLIESNISFGVQLLEAMQKNGVRKILNIGTRWQHVNDQQFNPANLYAATKHAFTIFLDYYKKQGIEYKTLELCDTFGKNDSRKKIVDLLVDACEKKHAIDLSPGEQVLDLMYVGDLCDYIIKHIENEGFFDGTTVSLSGSIIKLRELGRIIENIYGVKNILNWGGRNYRENEVMFPPVYFPCEVIETLSLTERLISLKSMN